MAINITALNLNVQNKTITISASEESGGYLTFVYIDTQKTFICSNEHSEQASKIELVSTDEEGNPLENVDINEEGKITAITNYVIELDVITVGAAADLDLENDMLFVFVDGSSYEVAGVLFDQNSLYQKVFKKIDSGINRQKCCEVNQETADTALLFEAFLLSWSTADPRMFINYWNILHDISSSLTSNCGCNG